ncbi:MAG: phosphonate metabolism transcriptional regulator PhnF [Pseudomonadota bacterium]
MPKDTWTKVRDAIASDLSTGLLKPGARLPTEPELIERFGVGRHSVRRALADLAREGRLSIEQGRGTFVLPTPTIEYAIGRRTRLRKNLTKQGIDVAGQALGAERVQANETAARALGISVGADLVVTRRLTHADGVPVSFGSMHHDAARFPDFPERRGVMGSVSETYRSYGIEDYVRGSTEIHARPAHAAESAILRQHGEMPVLVVRAIDTLCDGTPIAFSEVIWSAARVRFSFAPDEE